MPSNVPWRSRCRKDAVLAPVYHPLLHGGTRAGGVRALAYPADGQIRFKQNWPLAEPATSPRATVPLPALSHSTAVCGRAKVNKAGLDSVVLAYPVPADGRIRLKRFWPLAGAGAKSFPVVLAFGHSAAVCTTPRMTWSAAAFCQQLNLSSVGTANG